ncbi:MAG: PPOX class F420-dependent oxidoreductase [Deltaproteobacteria bacterium]|nr:PPOX class F420-dependent oxidoreductase [Deltaproteobacteria bacterium]
MADTVSSLSAPATRLDDLPFTAIGGQPAFAPGTIESFVREPRVAVLAYVRADGRPGQAPIWYTYRDGAFLMSTTAGSPKHRALARDPRVCLTIQDERPPYRALLADGRVTLEPLPQGDADPTAGMAVRYFGRVAAAEYDRMTAEEYARKGLVLITLRPTELRGFDNSRTLNAAVLAFVRLRDRLPIPRSWL